MDIWGEPHVIFFKLTAGFPLISIPDLKGLVMEFGGTPRNFFFMNEFALNCQSRQFIIAASQF